MLTYLNFQSIFLLASTTVTNRCRWRRRIRTIRLSLSVKLEVPHQRRKQLGLKFHISSSASCRLITTYSGLKREAIMGLQLRRSLRPRIRTSRRRRKPQWSRKESSRSKSPEGTLPPPGLHKLGHGVSDQPKS